MRADGREGGRRVGRRPRCRRVVRDRDDARRRRHRRRPRDNRGPSRRLQRATGRAACIRQPGAVLAPDPTGAVDVAVGRGAARCGGRIARGCAARGRRAPLPALDGRRRVADRHRGAHRAAPPHAGHERPHGAGGDRRGRDRRLRRRRLGAGALRRGDDPGGAGARPQPPVRRGAHRARARGGAGARRRRRADRRGRRDRTGSRASGAPRRARAAGRRHRRGCVEPRRVRADRRVGAGGQGGRRRGLRGDAQRVRRAHDPHDGERSRHHARARRPPRRRGAGQPRADRAVHRPLRADLHAARVRRGAPARGRPRAPGRRPGHLALPGARAPHRRVSVRARDLRPGGGRVRRRRGRPRRRAHQGR